MRDHRGAWQAQMVFAFKKRKESLPQFIDTHWFHSNSFLLYVDCRWHKKTCKLTAVKKCDCLQGRGSSRGTTLVAFCSAKSKQNAASFCPVTGAGRFLFRNRRLQFRCKRKLAWRATVLGPFSLGSFSEKTDVLPH